MKVLIVADVLGSENNGTTVACMNLVRYLRKTGNEVRIICCDEDKKGIENYYVVPTINFGILNGIVKKNEVTLAKVDKKILSNAIEGVDIVHIMIPFALGKAALKMAMKLGIPVTAGFHCQAENFSCHLGLMNSKIANKLIYKNFYNRFYKYVNAIHYPTNFIKNTFERAIKKETNAYVISNGVNDRFVRKKVEKPDNLRDKFVILSIGRYSQEKSHKILIKAVSLSKYKNNIT